MDLIIACFTEAHHNWFAAMLAGYVTFGVGAYVFLGVRAVVRWRKDRLFRRRIWAHRR